jgi:hypothetical protein
MAKPLWFGKYKGRTIEDVLAGDPEYLRWLCSQDDFRRNRYDLYRSIIHCVEELTDAPERKAMRARFQDADFCRRFLQASGYETLLLHKLEAMHAKALGEIADRLRHLRETTSKAKNYADNPNHQAWARANGIIPDPADREQQIAGLEQRNVALLGLHKRIPNRIAAPEPKISCRFEQHGFDIIMRASVRYPWAAALRKNHLDLHDDKTESTIAIKIRWTIGNNYPATIGWISWNRNISLGNHGSKPIADHVVLLAGQYNGKSATKEQFIRDTAAADIKVIFVTELPVVHRR